jgi:hypothetical protein
MFVLGFTYAYPPRCNTRASRQKYSIEVTELIINHKQIIILQITFSNGQTFYIELIFWTFGKFGKGKPFEFSHSKSSLMAYT